jgi:hypothetical protein
MWKWTREHRGQNSVARAFCLRESEALLVKQTPRLYGEGP